MAVSDIFTDRDIIDRINAATDYFDRAAAHFERAARREKLDEQRHQELIRVHQQGWKMFTDAVTRGLADIADAIRHAR